MDWHPAQVKAALEMRGTNLSKLAKQHGYAHINEVLHRPWVAAEHIVARALGSSPKPSGRAATSGRATGASR
ncbi:MULTISPECIES: helix-turn-helix domain-containing protein [unclassified Variovorax]|uniref:helix-turn-helix domain-containing protein n=1 Tax=unclassified Variovorax TaxID=663243 RepID=UPI001C4306CC